jgi:hypothetical protein
VGKINRHSRQQISSQRRIRSLVDLPYFLAWSVVGTQFRELLLD